MKLDVTCMRYLTKDDYRVLTAVEMGMRNHELVPVNLIMSIAGLRHGGSYKILSTLLRYKLVAHNLQEYDGYRLSYQGYDILALHTLQSRGIIETFGSQIGIGKESDIFEAMDAEGNEVVVKIHRLGRTSFRAVRKTRDYMQGKSKASWLYMSRLAAIKEYAFMKALHAHGFPTPAPLDQNRHIVAMSRINGFPLAQIKSGKLQGADIIFAKCMEILKRLAEHGLVHCDFNEFNLMIDHDFNITMIDFPQMVSTVHPNADELLERDINCLLKFFTMKMKYLPPDSAIFRLEDLLHSTVRIDEEIKASGYDEEIGGNIMEFEIPSEYLAGGKKDFGEESEEEEGEEGGDQQLIDLEQTEVEGKQTKNECGEGELSDLEDDLVHPEEEENPQETEEERKERLKNESIVKLRGYEPFLYSNKMILILFLLFLGI